LAEKKGIRKQLTLKNTPPFFWGVFYNFMKSITVFFISMSCILAGISCNEKEKSRFELIWQYDYKQDSDGLSIISITPLIDGEQIFIASDEMLSAIDIKSGKLNWDYTLPDNSYIAMVEFVLDETSIYLKEDNHHIGYSFNKQTGDKAWEIELPDETNQFANDAIDTYYIYMGGDQADIFKLNKTGEFISTYDLKKYTINTDARSIRILNNQLIFSQYFRKEELDHDSGRILSIDKETEEVLWEYRTDKGGYIFEPILLEEGIIYAGVTDGPGEFVALDATNGAVIWQAPGVVSHAYTLTDSMVLVQGGITLRALDKFTGEELWNTGLKFGGGHGQENIAYLNGYVYHIHSGSMWILEANTGEIVHREGISGYLITAGEDKIFVQGSSSLRAYTAWK
jgi:outer membrane protein assembly factor BamB